MKDQEFETILRQAMQPPVDLAETVVQGRVSGKGKTMNMKKLMKKGILAAAVMALLTTMKGLPLAYNKDMQEDKEGVFDAIDTVKLCLQVLTPMVDTMTVHTANMKAAAQKGFINATDLADYLVKKGLPFRSAYKIAGELVATCVREGKVLEELTLEQFKQQSALFEADLYTAIDLQTCVEKRISEGGPTPASVEKQIAFVLSKLGQ